MMKSPKTRASKAVLKARAARDLAAIDGDQAVFRIEEAQRRRMVAEAREQYEELIEVVDDDEFEFVETAGRQLGESESADERVE